MDSLRDILGRKDFDEPPEMAAIKKFVLDTYQETVGVTVRERDIVVTARSAALANTLRLNVRQLQAAGRTNKRITFRIGL